MKADAILNADVLDIIFENRNKDYGAYSLRKFYNNRLYKALGFTFTLVTLFTVVTFFNKENALPIPFISDPYFMHPPPVKSDIIPEKPKGKVSPQKPASPKISPPPQIFANNIQITKEHNAPKIEDLNENLQIGTEKIEGKPGEATLTTPKAPEVLSTNGNGEPIKPAVDKIAPNNFAEVMPGYPGGMAALKKFLEKNLKNPQDLEAGEQVKVKIKFIVGYDGNLKGFETIQDGGIAFNNEVIRVLKKMPQWIPGKTKGENVSVYYTIPVNFLAAD